MNKSRPILISNSNSINFNQQQLELLLNQQAISAQWPWCSNDEAQIEQQIRSLIAQLCQTHKLHYKAEFNSYGSGYASFVDVWFYQDDPAFRLKGENHYQGVFVLFSQLSHYFVVGEGRKSWHSSGAASGYLPSLDALDCFANDTLGELADHITETLQSYDMIRLYQSQLTQPLASQYSVPTLLSEPPWTQFDALFYWED